MGPQPDPRWEHFVAGVTDAGLIRPITFEVLDELASSWADLLPAALTDGPASLLRTAGSLFTHSWFDYEFMPVACLVGFQAMEAAFRELYPDAYRTPFRALVDRARSAGVLPSNIADLAETGVELRNLYSHPAHQTAFTIGMAGSMLENTHRLVALVVIAAAEAG